MTSSIHSAGKFAAKLPDLKVIFASFQLNGPMRNGLLDETLVRLLLNARSMLVNWRRKYRDPALTLSSPR